MTYLIFGTFIFAAITSLILVPLLPKLAVRFGGMDRVEDRKVHQGSVPRLGGIAIFVAFLLPCLLVGALDAQTWGLFAGAIVIFLTGLADDFISLRPRYKLCGEILAATVGVVVGGLSLSSLGNPLGFGDIELGVFAIPFTVFAVVGVINAINLIDGLDGLAGGISVIACVALGVLAYKTGNSSLLILTVALLGGILGFLRYNTFPAKIFMGDSGSLFIGYCLAFFSVKLVVEGHGVIAPAVPVIILGIPVVDTLVVMVNRLRKGKKIFLPDKTHIHHRLLDLGIDHKFCVFLVYGVSYLLCLFAVLFYAFSAYQMVIAFLAAAMIFYAAVDYFSRRISRKSSGETGFPTDSRRKTQSFSNTLLLFLKYFLILILLLSFSIPLVHGGDFKFLACCLLLLFMGLLFSCENWDNMIFQVILFFNVTFILYMMENYGAGVTILGIPMLKISNILFFLLFIAVSLKIVLRKRWKTLIDSPFEHFMLFIVFSVSLLPLEVIGKYHLFAVTGKSVLLFVTYKFILMHQPQPKRNVLFATGTALFAFSLIFLV